MHKRGKAKPSFERRSIETFSGFKTSDGKTWPDRIQAIAVQAKLDLTDIIGNAVNFEDGDYSDLLEVMRTDRDLIIELMTEAFMTPDEIGAKLDEQNRGVSSKGKHGVGKHSEASEDFGNSASYMTATPCMGVDKPMDHFASHYEITDELPSDVIGECVTQAVHAAWRSGFDPALDPFLVIVTFQKERPIFMKATNEENLERFRNGGLSPAQAERVEGEARAMYNIECSNHPEIHDNRHALWDELKKGDQDLWRERAALKLFPQ